MESYLVALGVVTIDEKDTTNQTIENSEINVEDNSLIVMEVA